MTDEPTVGEALRNYKTLREDMHREFTNLNTRLDKMPTGELLTATLGQWTAQLSNLTEDIVELKADRARSKLARQWLVGAVLVPTALAIFAVIVAIGGAR